MDAQRKKGILEVCVLAVLKKGPSYGYMIIRELEQCVEVSESTLYPILKRLEQNGSLETYRLEYNGRMRKYYRLTQEGQYKIDLFLEEWDELQKMYRFVEEQNRMTSAEDSETGTSEVQEDAESAPETEPVQAADSATETEPVQATEAAPETETTQTAESAPETEPVQAAESAPKTKTVQEAEAVREIEPMIQSAESVPTAKPIQASDPAPETKPVPAAEATSVTESIPEPGSISGTAPDPESIQEEKEEA